MQLPTRLSWLLSPSMEDDVKLAQPASDCGKRLRESHRSALPIIMEEAGLRLAGQFEAVAGRMDSGVAAFLFCDESLEVRYGDGGRLCLSPCATHFLHERPQPGAHPLQPPHTARHRTEFATSTCRDKVLQALNFRNAFSCRPFLPSSLIPSDQKIRLLKEISEVTWPSMDKDSECVTRLDDGSIRISSEDGHAHLYMPALQKEFTVEFLCQLSSAMPVCAAVLQNKEVPASSEGKATENKTKCNKRSKYFSCALQEDPPSCVKVHALEYTWLVQRYSTACCPPPFHYPMCLALHFHRQSTQQSDVQSSDHTCDPMDDCDDAKHPRKGASSALPQSLPLNCPATHLHRWNVTLENEDFLTTHPLPLKVVFYNGALYRYNLDGSPSLEVYPGDGSVFLSDGDGLGKYFKHYFLDGERQIGERVYTFRDLPPDKPRAVYSVRSIITQARRFLELCCSKKLTLNSLSHLPCWTMVSGSEERLAAPVLLEQCFMPDKGNFAVYSDNMVLARFLDGVILFMIWSFTSFNKEDNGVKDSITVWNPLCTYKHERLAWCRLQFPNGASKLIELEAPREYTSYIRPAVAWCRWLDENSQSSTQAPIPRENWSVEAEIKKIQRFNCILF
ncbi:uncharacterized protein C5orf34 homolog [Gastrophryne carolinensis]